MMRDAEEEASLLQDSWNGVMNLCGTHVKCN